MLQQEITADRVLKVVQAHPDCTLDEVTQELKEINWSDVFLAVDSLSRSGHLRLTQSSFGLTTTLRVP
jgi:hypothetical protein